MRHSSLRLVDLGALPLLVAACAGAVGTVQTVAPTSSAGATDAPPVSAGPLPSPGSRVPCRVSLTVAGPIELTFDGSIVGQVGWSGSPEQWGISLDDSTDTVDVRLADDSTVPMTWLLSIADTDGSGPRLPFLTIRFDGPVVREGDTGRHEVSLEYGWQSEAPPGSSIGTPIGALEFDGTTASFDVELLGPLREDPRAPIGTVTAVGAVDCP